jgi:excinuclease ABC subunit C
VAGPAGFMKTHYRTFNIKSEELAPGDDYGMMREVLRRRFSRLVKETPRGQAVEPSAGEGAAAPHIAEAPDQASADEQAQDAFPAWPDLVLIDGGKGQLSAAYEALEEIGLGNLIAVGIAKREELLFTRDRPEPIALSEHDPALLLIQRIRDEAHRFAVTFHRKARSMRDLRSELDQVPGIGPRRRRALLTAFGSLAGVRRATREELGAVVGARAAGAVIDYFAKSA